MEQLPASLPQPLSHPPQDAAKRILLLDCDTRRRELRAEALVNLGVLVDRAAETIVARTLWKPGLYDLVLIELRGADADCAAFIACVHGECAAQKFGFYVAKPPFVTASVEKCRSSMEEQMSDPMTAQQRRGDPFHSTDGTGLVAACQRIATVRQLGRVRAQAREVERQPEIREERSRGVSASEAIRLAGRILDGSQT
jgi:hypothetical protein